MLPIFAKKWHHKGMFFKRTLNLQALTEQKSHFLLGPRSTGKSLWIAKSLTPALSLNLLEQDLLKALLIRPSELRERVEAQGLKPGQLVVIDEIQKAPALLDEAHNLIESRGLRFLLTGSSARKLKRGAPNLLGGRAWMASFFPLTWKEIGNHFDLAKYLNFGGLPQVYTSPFPEKEIKNYIDLYVREEIQQEGFVRNLSQFHTFFETVGLLNGQELNYDGWASDTGIPRKTLQNYVELLKDTLMAFELPAFTKTKKRKAISRSKLYFFDVGVANALSQRPSIRPSQKEFGPAFEHFIIQECRAQHSYLEKKEQLTYWRSYSKKEVDLCLGTEWALEIKGKKRITSQDLKNLKALREEDLFQHYGVVSLEKHKRVMDGMTVWPWEEFLELVSSIRAQNSP